MKPHRFHILSVLADRDLHGLGIVREIKDQTDDKLKMWPATLYGELDALAKSGLIQELSGDQLEEYVSARRRYYRITDSGREALRKEAHRLATIASTAIDRLERA